MKEETQNSIHKSTDSEGFFKRHFNEFKSKLSEQQVLEFSHVNTDEERISYVAQIFPNCSNVTKEENCGKDANIAQKYKEKGNAEFIRGDTEIALESYSKALHHIPFTKESNVDYAVLLANRSAAFYHLELFNEALQDLDFALSCEYPKELRYKALERKAKCLLALMKHQEAMTTFRSTLSALDDCKLSADKKMKIQKNIQMMLGVMTKPTTKQGHVNAFLEGDKAAVANEVVSVVGKKNATYPSVSAKVAILEAPVVGRYAAATSEIDVGEIVAVEKSYCSVLLKEQAPTHCLTCFKWLRAPYPCEGCSVAVYCGRVCREEAEKTFHKYECGIANALYQSGASITVIMALRILTQKNLQYFLNLKPSLKEPRENIKKYLSSDYLPVYHLVRHENQRNVNDFLERTAMAVFLLRCLKKVGYFSENSTACADSHLTDDEVFIGGLILRHLQLLQFNAHEIAELETDCTESLDKAVSIFVGGGLFPSLALFNHSCEPAVIRYFVGTTVVVRVNRPVEQGEAVAENYGPIFTTKERADRQKTLRAHYWFDCACVACEEDWPTLAKMNRKVFRFRCASGEGVRCNGVIEIAHDTGEFMPLCPACQRHTNALKGLKTLQDTDAMFRQATNDTNKGNFKAALSVYMEILRLLNQYLKPPFYDYYLCQQAIRKCMLTLGNRYARKV